MSTAILNATLEGSPSAAATWRVMPRVLLIGWLLALVLLCTGLGGSPVRRTQEARVLETARQMVQPQLDQRPAFQRWLVPMLNGQWRLRKPPLAYWMTAIAYKLLGVGRFAGRLPAVLCAWLTLLVTFRCGRWLMRARGGAISAVCLFSSYMFFRHARLAETDSPAVLFCTLAIYAWWRGVAGDSQAAGISRSKRWFLLGAIATAGAVMVKGGPGAFPPIFLIVMLLLHPRRGALRQFLLSGAPLVFLLLALPWFAYTWHVASSEQFGRELDVVVSGEDHPGTIIDYVVLLFVTTAPWCGLLLTAFIAQIAGLLEAREEILSEASMPQPRWRGARTALGALRSQPAVGALLVWIAAIFLPLCCIGNKQPHYLLPLMPPLMLLLGWWLEKTVFRDDVPISGAWSAVVGAMIVGTILVVPAVLIVARKLAGHIRPIDIIIVIATIAMVGCTCTVLRQRGYRQALVVYMIGASLLVPMLVGIWMPRLQPDESQFLARQLRERFGDGPYAYWGNTVSLPLCFNLRQAIPYARSIEDLEPLLQSRPGLILIHKATGKFLIEPPPAPFIEAARLKAGGYPFVIYRRETIPASSRTDLPARAAETSAASPLPQPER